MVIVLIYFVLLTFWIELSLEFSIAQYLGLGVGFSLSNISLLTLVFAWLITVKNKNKISFASIDIYIILFCSFILISSFVEVLSYKNWSNLKQFFVLISQIVIMKKFLNPLILYFLLFQIIEDKNTCYHAINGMIILLILTVLTVFLDQYTPLNLGTRLEIGDTEVRYSNFGDPNQHAVFFVLLMPTILSYSIIKQKIKNKAFAVSVFILACIGMISTVSRGGFIGLFAALGIFFLFAYKENLISGLRIVILVATIFPLAGIVTSMSISTEVKDVFEYKVFDLADDEKNVNPWGGVDRPLVERYTSGRISKWVDSFQLFMQSPIWGHGQYRTTRILDIVPHNDYLHILLKYGLIGFSFYLLVYIKIFFEAVKFVKLSTLKDDKFLFISFLSGLIGYLVCMFGVGFYEVRYIFWLYTAIVFKLATLEEL